MQDLEATMCGFPISPCESHVIKIELNLSNFVLARGRLDMIYLVTTNKIRLD